jgi:hypothetical protein
MSVTFGVWNDGCSNVIKRARRKESDLCLLNFLNPFMFYAPIHPTKCCPPGSLSKFCYLHDPVPELQLLTRSFSDMDTGDGDGELGDRSKRRHLDLARAVRT